MAGSQHPSSEPSPASSPTAVPASVSGPDLAAIAAMLGETARALQAFSDARPIQGKEPPDSAGAGETRRYYLSPATLRHERDLLQRYKADDFGGLLTNAHTLLAGLVKIMKCTHPDARLRGRSVSSLGASLEQVSTLLARMCNVYDSVERIPS